MRSIRAQILGRNEVMVGTNVTYGKYHQLGMGVPQRRFLGIDDRGRREVTAIVARYIVDNS